MMFMLHYLEFFLFSVVQTGPYLTENKKQMNWSDSFNHCKLSTLKNVKDLNVTNVWLVGLYLQTPWMAHRGCFYNTGTLDIPPQPYSHSRFDWNITSACSYKCRKNKFFALKAESCVCLNSLSMMEVKKMENCILVCNGSKKDPCGAARFYTIYEQHDTNATDFVNSHKVERWTTYNRRPVIKWIINETLAEISNETANFHNVKCVLLNENLRYVPKSCNLTFSALCEYESEKDHTENIISARTGIIVGGILEFIFALVIIVVFTCIYCRRKRNKKEKKRTGDEERENASTTANYHRENDMHNTGEQERVSLIIPTTPAAATQLDGGQYFVLDPGATGFNRSNTNYSEKDNEAQYASSSDGVYDVTNERRHIEKDEINIYSHTVDDVYDTSAHDRRGKERDNAYDDCVIQNDG